MANTKSYEVLNKLIDKIKLEENSALLRRHGNWKINSLKYENGDDYGKVVSKDTTSVGNITSGTTKPVVTVPVDEGTYIVTARVQLTKNDSTVYSGTPRMGIKIYADETTAGTYDLILSSQHTESLYNKGLSKGNAQSGTTSTTAIIWPKSGFQVGVMNETGATLAGSYDYKYMRIK